VILATCAGCGGSALDIELAARPVGGSDRAVQLVNASPETWTDVHLIVQEDVAAGQGANCTDQRVTTWAPGDGVDVPVCGDRVRITVEVGGTVAMFSYHNNTLYRKIGRKEVPLTAP